MGEGKLHPWVFLFFCDRSTSQRGVAWVPRRTGRRSRKPLQPTEKRGLSTARTATVLASGPWSSTWPVSTCWRASRSQRPSSSLSLGFTRSCPTAQNFPEDMWCENHSSPSSPCTHQCELKRRVSGGCQREFAFAVWVIRRDFRTRTAPTAPTGVHKMETITVRGSWGGRHKPKFSYFHHFFQCGVDKVDRSQEQTFLSLSLAIPVFTTCLDNINLLRGVMLDEKKKDVMQLKKLAMHDAITTKSLCLLGQCLFVLSRKQVLCKISTMILQPFLHFWHEPSPQICLKTQFNAK